ncbi:MAG: 50S ribosomal protein L35 [Candidatus Peribacteria bacterium]|nr:MAG: 50S ribosomal protein L35 [Candidatus Peribacteria bacterium]
MGKAKLKTNKSMAKRIKVTKTGKLRHSKTCRNHLLMNKGNATKKHKFGKELLGGQIERIKRLITAKLR